MKLISMTEFVLEIRKNKEKDNIRRFWTCERYAKFLKQILELWMFVPCKLINGVLVVLEEPKWENEETDYEIQTLVQDYQQAKERCLFEGFEIITKDFDKKPYKFIQNKDTYVAFLEPLSNEWKKVNDYECIEDLVLYKFPLTQTAIKQLGL